MSTVVKEHVSWLDRLRQRGMDDFRTLGFPTTRLENWKYTNVAPIGRIDFEPAAIVPDLQVSAADRSRIHAMRLSEALRDPKRAAIIENHLGRYASTTDHAFAAWNTACFADGAYVEVPQGTVVERPIHLVFRFPGHSRPAVTHPRNLIVAGEGCQIALIQSFAGPDDSVYLTNVVTEIVAEPNAIIDYYKVEREGARSFHIAVTEARLARDATLTARSMSFGGALVRNDLNVKLDGEGAQCMLNGLFVVDGRRLVDHHTRIDHRRPHATSRELYKGVLTGKAQGVFNGAIVVSENAQKTDALQYSKNLLLSRQAQINTKPQLEIRNNDVRCFHGATIGQIDDEAVFYLKSRGLEETEAKRILVRGFAREIIDGIQVASLRNESERLLDAWLDRAWEEL